MRFKHSISGNRPTGSIELNNGELELWMRKTLEKIIDEKFVVPIKTTDTVNLPFFCPLSYHVVY